MLRLLVADKNVNARKQIASILIEAGYDVMVTDSAVKAMQDVLHNNARVLLLGAELEELNSAELLPLLKQCNRRLAIILVANEASLPLLRKVRKEGIFYHALRPAASADNEEIRQVVKCAIHSLSRTPNNRNIFVH